MLNAMANHGYLPRSGKNITLQQLQDGFEEGVNFVADILTQAGTASLSLSTTGNPETFDLADTAVHNVIEHDGSLSRQDAALGDHIKFNLAIWNTVVSKFTGSTVPIATAAKARTARMAAAQAANPDFSLNDIGASGSLSETALYQIILGDRVKGNPPKSWVKCFFGKCYLWLATVDVISPSLSNTNALSEQERLPFNEGFKRSTVPIDQTMLDAMIAKVVAAS